MLSALGIINLVAFCAAILVAAIAYSLDDPDHRLRFVKLGLLATSLSTGLEVLAQAGMLFDAPIFRPLLDASELTVSMIWIGILQASSAQGFELQPRERRLEALLFWTCIGAYTVAVGHRILFGSMEAPWRAWELQMRPLLYVGGPILGLILCENVYRNAAENFRWRLKFLVIAVAMLLLFDLSVGIYDSLQRAVAGLYGSKALVEFLTLPMMLLACARLTRPMSQYSVSRTFIFHSTATLLGGLYLLVIALAAYYARTFELSVVVPIQITIVLAGLAGLLAVSASGSLKARVRSLLARVFYDLKYDYRTEWLRFIATISGNDGTLSLQQRLIKSVAEILESTGGALWEWDATAGLFVRTAEWNYALSAGRNVAEPAWIERLRSGDILSSEDIVDGDGFVVPDLWLLLPLLHENNLSGFIALRRSRSARELDAEDRPLLRTLVLQIASYLAEYRATRRLLEQREMKEFSDRVTFVVHDIKSIIAQLSLMLDNAKRVGENAEFRKDMLLTIGDSVNKMQRLLLQLRPEHAEPRGWIDIVQVLQATVRPIPPENISIDSSKTVGRVEVMAGRTAIESIFRQVIANAIEAAGEHGNVQIIVEAAGTTANVTVRDTGPGMDPEFVRDQLFRPLHSSKTKGYGVGMYQVRELLTALGGRIRVHSTLGSGTAVTLVFPCRVSHSKE